MSEYLGIPFRAGGRTRAGLDCLGLVMLVYRERLGINLPEPGYAHTRDPAIPGMIDAALWQWRAVARPQRYDVALFAGERRHVGLMVDRRRMLHVAHGLDSGVDPLEPLWSGRLIGFYRHASHSPA